MIELTCPSEEGFEAASVRKHRRYEDLVQNIRLQEWNPILMTVEVGVRGYVATSMLRCLHRLGFSNREVHQLRKAFSQVAVRCSYGIYLSRKNVHWDRQREPLVIPTLPSPVRAVVPPGPEAPGPEPETAHPRPSKNPLLDPSAPEVEARSIRSRRVRVVYTLRLKSPQRREYETLCAMSRPKGPWVPSLDTIPDDEGLSLSLQYLRRS